jgi:hypothetical protein
MAQSITQLSLVGPAQIGGSFQTLTPHQPFSQQQQILQNKAYAQNAQCVLPWANQSVQCLPNPCSPNSFDICLAGQKAVYDMYSKKGALTPRLISTPTQKITQRIRMNPSATIPVPSLVTIGLVVLTYTIPKSYRAYIEQLSFGFIPSGVNTYANGSGQLTWHLGINQWYQYDYGIITLDQGIISPGVPSPNLASGIGIPLQENDVVRLIVDVNSTTIGSGSLATILQGYMEPLR